MKKLFFVLVLVAFTFLGCVQDGTMPAFPSACDSVEGPSRLCELAAENNVNLSVVADGLGLANIIAIEKGLYEKEQAIKVLVGLRAFMESPVSYAAFRAELTETIKTYPYLLNTADRYLGMMVETQIMRRADSDLIKGWLDRLIAGLT